MGQALKFLAFLSTALFPGFGHMVMGRWRRAIVIAGLFFIVGWAVDYARLLDQPTYFWLFIAGGLLIWIAVAINAYRQPFFDLGRWRYRSALIGFLLFITVNMMLYYSGSLGYRYDLIDGEVTPIKVSDSQVIDKANGLTIFYRRYKELSGDHKTWLIKDHDGVIHLMTHSQAQVALSDEADSQVVGQALHILYSDNLDQIGQQFD